LWQLYMCLQCLWFTPPSSSFIPFSPLEQFQQVSLFNFCIHIESPLIIFMLLHLFCLPLPLLLVPSLRQDQFYLSALHFLKCILIVAGDFAVVVCTSICSTLLRFTPSIYLFFITLFPYYLTAYNVFHYPIFLKPAISTENSTKCVL
jgi:hypothetical protein